MMRLSEFLRYETKATELCIICNPWRVATFWIDHEDLFLRYVHPDLRNKYVVDNKWGRLETIDKNGNVIYIDAHYVFIDNKED